MTELPEIAQDIDNSVVSLLSDNDAPTESGLALRELRGQINADISG